jgi:hypothetical protein
MHTNSQIGISTPSRYAIPIRPPNPIKLNPIFKYIIDQSFILLVLA